MEIKFKNQDEALGVLKRIRRNNESVRVIVNLSCTDPNVVISGSNHPTVVLKLENTFDGCLGNCSEIKIKLRDMNSHSGELCELLKGCNLQLFHRNQCGFRFDPSGPEYYIDTIMLTSLKGNKYKINQLATNSPWGECIRYYPFETEENDTFVVSF